MRKIVYSILTVLAIVFLSCGPGSPSSATSDHDSIPGHFNARNFEYDTSLKEEKAAETPPPEPAEDTTVAIHFNEFDIEINGIAVFDKENSLDSIQKDSVYIYCELAYSIQGKVIRISPSLIDSLHLEQHYQTSLTVEGEGPHCDLLDWKHYTSEKRAMKEIGPGQFLFERYTREDIQKFPNVTMKQVKQEIKNTCGDGWYQAAKNCKAVTEYPCSVGISTYYITIKGILKSSGKRFSKLVTIDSPMGC